jgi:hypothetical protein
VVTGIPLPLVLVAPPLSLGGGAASPKSLRLSEGGLW